MYFRHIEGRNSRFEARPSVANSNQESKEIYPLSATDIKVAAGTTGNGCDGTYPFSKGFI